MAQKNLPSNIQLLGHQPQEALVSYLQKAQAFIFAAEEDFGIAPLEAQACGTPVIAYAKGGSVETITADGEKPTGVFFYQQTPAALKEAIWDFEKKEIRAADCRENALRYSRARFEHGFSSVVSNAYRDFKKSLG